MPLIYKSIRIDISEYTYSSSYASSRECINRPVSTLVVRLAAGPSVRAMVRSIHVFSRTVVHPNTLALLQSMVPNLSQLESFSWDVDGSFPAAFLEPLRQRWPKSHLHIRTNFYKCNIAKDWISLKLEPHMLCSLQVCMPDGAFRGGEKRALAAKKNLFWVLKNCPGLQSLTTYPQEGYNAGSSGLWYDMKLEDPLPQLSDLSVTDKTFETEDLVYWGAKGGWLRLERLTICNHRLLDGLHGCEESLRSINLINAGEGYEDSLLQICSRTTMLTELKSLEYLSVLGQFSQLSNLIIHAVKSWPYEENKPSLTDVEYGFRRLIEHSTESNLKSFIVRDDAHPSDWDNPGGVTGSSGQIIKATRASTAGRKDQEIKVEYLQGPSRHLENDHRQIERQEAERKTKDYLDAMPPAVLSQMIEANSSQTRGISSGSEEQAYEIQAAGWSPKLVQYEDKWKESSGILPMLEWQLQKRQEQGWKLWDTPLMESEAGSEGFLYDRIIEARAEF